MKFGLAPTTKQTRADTREILPSALHSPRCCCSRRSSGSPRSAPWTHAVYPIAAAALARVRTRRVRKEAIEPAVTVIVAAYNEEPVIERRLENLLALDYPTDRLELVVTSDASTDRTHELVERFRDRVRLIVNPRGGKVAQNRAVRETGGEIVAFSDANATWAPDALRQLVANFADPDVAYVCGRLVLEAADGSNKEGSTGATSSQREAESRLGSITGGNGSIYAVRRADYVEVDPKWGHDLSFPYRMVQGGPAGGLRAGGEAFERRRRRTRPSTGARCACSSTAGRSPCAARC